MKYTACATLLLVASLAQAGCNNDFRDCSEVDASAAESLPQSLSQTGLYGDIANDVVVDAAILFEPEFPLWTDGATKRRWLVLPESGQVDTTNPDEWVFPVGTKFFKEFTRDSTRLETRLNTRTADGWTGVAYIWNESGDDAVRQLDVAEDVKGTTHDVPSAVQCLACHGGRGNFSLGFSATQLAPETRSDLYDAGFLSDRVDAELQLEPIARAGLGTLHGNCAHCHNSRRDEQPQATSCYAPPVNDDDDPIDFSLPPDLASVEEAPAVRTARWQLGELDDSALLDRISTRNLSLADDASMPPLGTEVVDDRMVETIEAFIATLPPRVER
ncbi:MAG: hypothetical protein KDA24_05910 [Deltaproteobacteria bacterium]|nr:hypothetical protein [Deltaproteobacteria bacterium]